VATTNLHQKAWPTSRLRIHAVYITTASKVMKLPETETESIPENSHKMLHGRFVHAGKTNRLKKFGLWIAPKCVQRPGSARTRWGAIVIPQTS